MDETLTRELVVEKLVDYLNRRASLADLVAWAEEAMIEAEISPEDDTEVVMDVLAYVAAADTPDFPLTWDRLSDFLDRLGAPVRVEVVAR